MRTVAALAVSLTIFASPILSEYLKTGGSNFYYGGTKVFLSGVNLAWNSYGYDFGNGQYNGGSKAVFEDYLSKVQKSGGNTVRVWVHVEGTNTPQFDKNGYVTGLDRTGTLISDLVAFLDYAFERDIFVILVLWNGAVMSNDNYKNLFWDNSKLQSYIDKALVPLVKALKNKPALAAWEVLNEPEGSVKIESSIIPCFDTSVLSGTGAGYSNANIPMMNLLRFINWQSSAIHVEDPKALVTVGSWSEIPQTDQFGYRNYYKDFCLILGGGRVKGIIDFYQMHTYSWASKWNQNAPFKVADRWAYKVDNKPLLIGEFAQSCSEGESVESLFDKAYTKGYSGVLSWQYNAGGDCSDTQDVQNQGMVSLSNRNDQSNGKGGLVKVDIH